MQKCQILWIGMSDPWSKWTLSGISREICLELKRRGLLYGALSLEDLTTRHQHGPALLYDFESKIVAKVRKWLRGIKSDLSLEYTWLDEKDGPIGRVLRRCPAGTIVIYALARPNIDPLLKIRRFRWMDLSLLDAIKTGSFGHADMTDVKLGIKLAEEQRMLAVCEGVLALSTYAADSISRDISFPRELITPIGAGPALENKLELRKDPARFEAARILFVGRDWKRKRGDLIVDAFRILRKKIPHASLTIVGPEASPIPIEVGLNFVGPLNKEDPLELAKLQELFLNSSALCMASVSEPWGLVYVEAAQFGLPVVALNNWAVPDIVVDGVTGFLVSEPTPEQFAAALENIFLYPERSLMIGMNAQKRVETVLSWPAVIDRILQRVSPESLNGREPASLRQC